MSESIKRREEVLREVRRHIEHCASHDYAVLRVTTLTSTLTLVDGAHKLRRQSRYVNFGPVRAGNLKAELLETCSMGPHRSVR